MTVHNRYIVLRYKTSQVGTGTPPASRLLAMNNFMLRVKTSRSIAMAVSVLELQRALKSFPTAFCPPLVLWSVSCRERACSR